jgi:hypothetical protein
MFEALSVIFMCTHGNTVSTSTISLPETALILPNPIPSELLVACTKNSVASVLHISKRNCTQQHLNHDVFSVDLYDRVTVIPRREIPFSPLLDN